MDPAIVGQSPVVAERGHSPAIVARQSRMLSRVPGAGGPSDAAPFSTSRCGNRAECPGARVVTVCGDSWAAPAREARKWQWVAGILDSGSPCPRIAQVAAQCWDWPAAAAQESRRSTRGANIPGQQLPEKRAGCRGVEVRGICPRIAQVAAVRKEFGAAAARKARMSPRGEGNLGQQLHENPTGRRGAVCFTGGRCQRIAQVGAGRKDSGAATYG